MSGCWSIRRRSAAAPSCPKPRRCSASARGSADRRASSPMTGRPTASRSSCRSTATCISRRSTARSRRLTNTPGGELNPAVSPRGGYVSFVRDQNLCVQPLAGGAARAITTERRGHRPLGRGGVRRAGGDGPPHRLLVVARRSLHRGRAVRRGAGRHRHPRRDRRRRDQDLRTALSRRGHAQRAGRPVRDEARRHRAG